MVNAIRVAADFIARLPRTEMSPETTEGYEGYLHPYQVHAGGGSDEREGAAQGLRDGGARRKGAARRAARSRGRRRTIRARRSTTVVEESYRNMREVLEQHPQVVDHARDAIRRSGLEPVERPIRGGTDGSRLSFMGLPTPNLFAGEHNFHSRLEWVSAQDMDKAVEVIVRLCERWAE